MAGRTHLWVAPPEPLGIEARPVGVEVPAAYDRCRMTTGAVALRVTGDATLEILPRRLSVAGEEEPLGIMVPRVER